ncbi:arylesterase [Pedobacter sp. SYSU D00535]|uniref:arylesterase n=1 Tax=Pedobacter sp. SYSU D00535 TaxID=2810308 RepID=UPI001A964407|nr:arylesterase [Pedobacter sp. SYSU D00535]
MNRLLYLLLMILMAGCNNENNSGNNNAASNQKTADPKEKKNILFFGNSLTAGYGLEESSEAFPARIQEKIDSAGLNYRVINAGLSGETTAGGKNRIDWLLDKQKVDVFVLELGANDGLRGLPVTETKRNLQVIFDKVKAKYPEAKLVLLGMEIPPNMGGKYVNDFRAIFRQVADANDAAFVPFLLEGVAGNASLNIKDGIHPTGQGYAIVANNVWRVLKDVL